MFLQKSSKILIVLALIMAVSVSSTLIAKEKEIKIKTTAMCEGCKAKMDEGLKKVDGVSNFTYNATTKTLALKYDTEKTSPDKVKKAVKSLTCSGKATGNDCCGKDASNASKAECDEHHKAMGASSKDGCCSHGKSASVKSASAKDGCCSDGKSASVKSASAKDGCCPDGKSASVKSASAKDGCCPSDKAKTKVKDIRAENK